MHPKVRVLVAGVVVVLCVAVVAAEKKFPSDIKRCKPGDTECIRATAEQVIREKKGGYAPINLAKLSPLEIKAIAIKQGKHSPVNIDLKFRDSKLYGIGEGEVSEVKGFGENLAGPHELHLKGPAVSLIGNYTIAGKVLILPISGTGKSNITITDYNIVLSFDGAPLEKNGNTYMQTKNVKFTFDTKRVYMHFEDLFNGDKTLGDNMNTFLNENWMDIFGELKAPISSAFGTIFEAVINNVFAKYPYTEYFEKA